MVQIVDLPTAGALASDDFIPISQSGVLKKVAKDILITGVTDGDKGEVIVTSSGTVWTLDSGISATKIGDGSVDNNEFSYLNGVTSNIQTQINSISGVSAITSLVGGVTASGPGAADATVITNANLTGPITSVGNATAIAAQTGTGSTFVMQVSPTLTTPNLGTPTAGVLSSCTGLPISTGVNGLASGAATFLTTPSSANLAALMTNETGSGALVFADTPTLVTPVLGVASVTSINKVAITAPASAATLTIANNATLTVSASATISNGTHSGTNTGDQTDISGNAATVTVADAASDTTTFPLLATDATGSLSPRTDAGITYNASTNALTTTTFIGALTGNASTASTVTTNANLTGDVTSSGNATTLSSTYKKRTIGFSTTTPVTGQQGSYYVFPVAGTITAWNIVVDAGTATVKTWKIATGTTAPTSGNLISTSGVSLSSNTAIRSTTTSDFTTTAVSANDIFAFDLSAVSGVTKILFELEITVT